MDEQILMKLSTVAVYKQSMCTKEDNPSTNNSKGDNSSKISICVQDNVRLCDLTQGSSLHLKIINLEID